MAYMEGNVVGLAESFAAAEDLLPGYLHALAHRPVPYGAEAFGWGGLTEDQLTRPPYPHDLLHLRVQGGNADNAGPSLVPPSVVRAWNETYAYPKLVMSTNTAFFAAAEERLGDRLPEHTGDWTDWWADGLGSGARPLGYARRAQHALRHAETLHTLAEVSAGSGGGPARQSSTVDIDAVYDKLGLFDEHTWGAANPWHDHEDGFDSGGLQWARKCEMAYSGADDAEDLRQAGAHRLGARFAPAPDALASLLVTNLGPADRTDVAEAFLPASVVPLDVPVSIVDARDGATVPHAEEAVRPEDWPTRPSGRRPRFVLADVPSIGYVRVDVRPGEPSTVESPTSAWQVENEYYRVTVDPVEGVIASIFDKRTARELVNGSAYAGMNQYVHDRYSTAPHVNHLSGHVEAHPHDLALLAGRSIGRRASLVRASRTAIGEELEFALDGDGVDWLRTTVTLWHGVPRVEVTNRLYKQGAPAKESLFFAFPLAMPAPVAWELTGGVGGDGPTVPGAARHLTPIRHWVAYDDGELTAAWATLEAPLVMFGDLYLPYAPFPPTLRPDPPEPGTVYSWAMNNIWDTNFPAQQQGETTFRYAIASAAGADPRVLGAATAAGLTDPFQCVPVTGRADAAPPTDRFAAIDHPLVRVAAIGPSRRGHDLVVYLASTAAEAVRVELLVHDGDARVRAAWVGTSLERERQQLAVDNGRVAVPVPAGNLVAVSLELAR
jgi:hypothetical protein